MKCSRCGIEVDEKRNGGCVVPYGGRKLTPKITGRPVASLDARAVDAMGRVSWDCGYFGYTRVKVEGVVVEDRWGRRDMSITPPVVLTENDQLVFNYHGLLTAQT